MIITNNSNLPKVIEDIRQHFREGKKRILLVAPTGSGKTVIACSMMEGLVKNNRFGMFVAHRRELVMQCSRKLADFEIKHGVIMAGKSGSIYSDVQVASVQTFSARKDNDDFVKPQADVIILDVVISQ